MTWIDGVAALVFALCAMGAWMWSLVTHPRFLWEWLVWGLFTSAAMGVALVRIDVEPFEAVAGGLFFGFFTTGLGLLRYRSPPWPETAKEERDRHRHRPPVDLGPPRQDD
jgi:hypothetical protein